MSKKHQQKVHERGSRYQRLIEWTLYFLLALVPLVYCPGIIDFAFLPKAAVIQTAAWFLLLLWLLKTRSLGTIEMVRHPVLVPLALWLAWSGLSVIWAIDKFAASTMFLHWISCAILLLIAVNCMKSSRHVDRIIMMMLIGAWLVSIIGIAQYLFGITTIPQAYPPASTFSNKNFAAEFINAIWPLAAIPFLLDTRRGRYWLYAILSGVALLFMIFTKTKAVWLAICLSALALVVFSLITGFRKDIRTRITRGKLAVVIAALLIAAGMAILPMHARLSAKRTQPTAASGVLAGIIRFSGYHPDSVFMRLASWRNTLPMIKARFPLGVGLDNWPVSYPIFHSSVATDPYFSSTKQPESVHCEPLQVLAETSLPGFAMYAAMMLMAFYHATVAFRRSKDPDARIRLVFGMTALAAFNVESLFSFPLRAAAAPLVLMMLIAVFITEERADPAMARHLVIRVRKPVWNLLAAVTGLILVLVVLLNLAILSADAHCYRGTSQSIAGNWDDARREFRRASALNRWRKDVWFELGRACNKLTRYKEAADAYRQVVKINPYYINGLFNLGNSCALIGNLDEASTYMQRALDIMPTYDKALMGMASVRSRQKRNQEAAAFYERALSSKTSGPEANYQLGRLRLADGRLEEAKLLLEKAADLSPKRLGIHYNLGIIFEKLGRPNDAVSEFRQEIGLKPGNSALYGRLARLTAETGRTEEALALYEKALEKTTNPSAIHLRMALLYFNRQNYPSAWKHARMAEKGGQPGATDLITRLKAVSAEPQK